MKRMSLAMGAVSLIASIGSCGGGSTHAGAGSDAGLDGTGGSSGGGSGSSSGSSGGGSGSGGSSGGAGSSSGSTNKDGGSSSDGAAIQDAGYTISPLAYYVATNGNDSNPGTLAEPFATLAKAQKAMQGSATFKTTYVRAGTYTPAVTGGNCVWGNAAGSSIGLSSADEGETWSYYPPDGYGSAVLDGQSTAGNSGGDGGNGTGCAFGASQVANVTIVGLEFQNYLYAAIWGWSLTGAVIRDNEVHDTQAAAFAAGGIILTASPGAVVENNYVHDVAYMGIVIADNSAAGDSMSNTTVANNVVLNSCTWPAVSGAGNDQNGGDCGAIYFWSQQSSVSTGMRITNNYVRDVNASSEGAGDFGSCCTLGIYLDQGTNNVTETGNVVTGVTSACFMLHGGENLVLRGNLCDIGTSGTEAIVTYQNTKVTQMTGNVFEDNVVVAGSTGPGDGFAGSEGPPTPMTIENNAYFNYAGSTVDSAGTGGAGSDSDPTYVNPGISCWAPSVASGSPVLGSPVDFPGIAGGWGPPGFTIPKTGTPPSWPHGC
jgi:Right handed beta helix region